MGHEWEVYAYRYDRGMDRYYYAIEYGGDSRDAALAVADELKRQGIGCIKIEWRPAHD